MIAISACDILQFFTVQFHVGQFRHKRFGFVLCQHYQFIGCFALQRL